MKKYIFIVVLFCTILLGACKKENKAVKISNTLEVNKAEALDIQRVEFQIVEGHSHAKAESRNPIGSVMWANQFNEGAFHGNPYVEENTFPLKRIQYLVYDKQEGKSYIKDLQSAYNKHFSTNKQPVFYILSSTPREKYLNGVLNALIVRLYDKNKQRLDLKLKSDEYKNRVQVFYEVQDAQPLFSKYNLDKKLDKKQICYYWYYDRRPVLDNNKLYEDGDYIKDEALGLRGVIQALEPMTRFNLRMSISILPEGMQKSKDMHNSISPSPEQAKHIVFQFDIPFAVISEYPNFYSKAENAVLSKTGKKFSEMTDADYEEIDKLSAQYKLDFFKNLQDVFTDESLKDLQDSYSQLLRQPGESSNFYL